MNNQKKLKEKYPNLFTEKCEFRYDKGWNSLIESTCFTIEETIKASKKKYIYYPFHKILTKFGIYPGRHVKVKGITDVKIDCIKEKFGNLRVCYNGGNEQISSIIYLAEVLSWTTCEICSNMNSTLTSSTYLKTLCPKCKEKEGKNNEIKRN